MFLWLLTLILSLAIPLISGIILLAVWVWYRQATWLVVGLGALYAALCFWPYISTMPTKRAGDTRILFLNARVIETNIAHQIQHILAADADIVALVETRNEWDAYLPQLQQRFPYTHRVEVGARQGGLNYQDVYRVLSRWPITHESNILGQGARFNIQAAMPFIMAVVHPLAPLSPQFLVERNAFLKHLAAKKFETSSIIVGDFNTVPWDTHFIPLLRHSNLNWQGTWLPTYRRKLPVIPIDHAFTTEDIKVRHIKRWTAHESDHFGLMLDIIP